MLVLNLLKKLLSYTSIYFTVFTPIYAAFLMITNVSSEEPAVEMYRLLLIFLFAFLAGISQVIYGIQSMHKALRVLIQYVIIAFASYICFFMQMAPSQALIGVVFASVIYFACFGIGSFFSWRFRMNTKKEEIYEKKFKK